MEPCQSLCQKRKQGYLYIVPYLKVIKDELEERKYHLTGFGVKAVFRVEDTQGSELEYENIELPDVPLMEERKNGEYQ